MAEDMLVPAYVESDQLIGDQYFLCRFCNGLLAAGDEFILRDNILDICVLRHVFNVNLAGNEYCILDQARFVVKNVCCTRCHSKLGWKFVNKPSPNRFIAEGSFLLSLNKIVFWNGYRNVDLVTGRVMPLLILPPPLPSPSPPHPPA